MMRIGLKQTNSSYILWESFEMYARVRSHRRKRLQVVQDAEAQMVSARQGCTLVGYWGIGGEQGF